MNRRALRTALVVAGFLISFAAGVVVGSRWTYSWMHGFLETEVLGSLNFRLDALAALRLGEPETAIRVLEPLIDPPVATLTQRREWVELPEEVRRSLVLAKGYRERYPRERPSAPYDAAYAAVPDEPIDPQGRRVVERLLQRAQGAP
ncbi:MAG: hypothetical protein H6511_08200 [Holophagales bacterium]|nr:hypothetical protein [Holophagales bacterium]